MTPSDGLYFDEDLQLFTDSPLPRPTKSCLPDPPDLALTGNPLNRPAPVPGSPGQRVLFSCFPQNRNNSASSDDIFGITGAMSAPAPPPVMADMPIPSAESPLQPIQTTLPIDASATAQHDELKATAVLAMQETDKTNGLPNDVPELCHSTRVDSACESEEKVPQISSEKKTSPLTVQTHHQRSLPPREDSITNSPTLARHVIQIETKTANTLPMVQQPTSPAHESTVVSPRKASLPGFQQLANLADIATQQASQQDPRAPSIGRHHSQSFGSAASPPIIPILPSSSYANSAQTSPVSYQTYSLSARSPTSTVSDGPGPYYGSPHQYHSQAYFSDRRSSTATEGGRPFQVPSLPSNSSAESHGTTGSSSTDGYSTVNTTPLDGPGPSPPDDMSRRVLPPPVPGMAVIPAGGFKCDYPGCNSVPFQTQYLLSSHRNVHSQNRPHYCPVKDCPRSEGGKGFKRKNEMIRHGLVHSSPGYICPFCPDREHKYPRPDNLQRHVRVHHVDKDRDDPALREVLAQRSEGSVQKQRRRRTQGASSQGDISS